MATGDEVAELRRPIESRNATLRLVGRVVFGAAIGLGFLALLVIATR